MAEGSRRSSKQSSIRSNPPPPPPRQRSKREGNGGRSGKSVTSARTRETNRTKITSNSTRSKSQPRVERSSRSRSKSRPRESQQQREIRGNRSRSKSRPRESPAKEDNNKRRSRSKSTPRQQSQKQQTHQVRPVPNNNKQHSNKKSPKSNTAGGGSSQRNGSSSTRRIKKQPSAKKREKFAANAKKAIPATVHMISGSHDIQTSSDVSNITSQFQLPNPAGRSGGACTAALLQVLYESHEHGDGDMSWVDVLRQMRIVLDEKGFDQTPQLSSSRNFDVHNPFVITPTDGSFNHKNNTQVSSMEADSLFVFICCFFKLTHTQYFFPPLQRAVLIGINYTGQSGQLTGCHNDVHNVSKYLTEVQGFRKENITILMDDGRHKAPTKAAIMNGFKRVVKESKDGDVVFIHYSGHGGRLRDDNGDEEDGYDETLIPLVSSVQELLSTCVI